MPENSTAKERIESGLDSIPADRMVSVSLRDLRFVHRTLGEFMQFFHQPLHFAGNAAVQQFLDDPGDGGFKVLREAHYSRARGMLPLDIEAAFDRGERFEHPLPPSYFTEGTSQASSGLPTAKGEFSRLSTSHSDQPWPGGGPPNACRGKRSACPTILKADPN